MTPRIGKYSVAMSIGLLAWVIGCSAPKDRNAGYPHRTVDSGQSQRFRVSTSSAAAAAAIPTSSHLVWTLVVGGDTVRLDNAEPLERLVQRLGPVEVTVGTHDQPWRVCYVISSGAGAPLYLSLESDSDMGGPGHDVSDYTLSSRLGVLVQAGRCRHISVAAEDIETGNGIRIGMSHTEVERRIGAPTRRTPGAYVYEYAQELPLAPGAGGITQATSHEINASLTVRFDADAVSELSAGYLDSM